MKKQILTKDACAHRLWEAVRELRKTSPASEADALALAQSTLGELTSHFLQVLLADHYLWSKDYWFDGVEVDSLTRTEPHGVELVGRAHFARGQEHWFTAPACFTLSAPPDAPLSYQVLFDDLRWESEEDRKRKSLAGPTRWRFSMGSAW